MLAMDSLKQTNKRATGTHGTGSMTIQPLALPQVHFILEVRGDRDPGIEETLPALWVEAARVSYVPICCRW